MIRMVCVGLVAMGVLLCRAEERPVVPIAPGSLTAVEPPANIASVPLEALPPSWSQALAEALDLAAAHAPHASKGMSVAVLVPGVGWWTAQRGVDGRGNPVGPATRFHAGSAGKLITAALVARAVKQGRIDPLAPLSQYIDVPSKWRSIPVGTLLNHSSGIPSFEMNRAYDRSKAAAPRELLRLAGSPLFPAGRAHSYSNTGYVVLGLVLEKAEGKPWARQVADELFARLPGLSARTAPECADGDFAVGYAGGAALPFLADYRNVFSCGGVVCSAADLARLYDGILNGRLLPPEAVRFLLSDLVWIGKSPEGIEVRAGRGIQQVVTPVGTVLMHGGAIPGFVCTAGVNSRTGVAVAVMANDAETVTDPYFFALLKAAGVWQAAARSTGSAPAP
jgi:CubicO group peptidase (beta-lactamase class C family)